VAPVEAAALLWRRRRFLAALEASDGEVGEEAGPLLLGATRGHHRSAAVAASSLSVVAAADGEEPSAGRGALRRTLLLPLWAALHTTAPRATSRGDAGGGFRSGEGGGGEGKGRRSGGGGHSGSDDEEGSGSESDPLCEGFRSENQRTKRRRTYFQRNRKR
jgi:uncharacterized membrane protein YgcG